MSILTAEPTIAPPQERKSCCGTHEAYPDDVRDAFERHFDYPFDDPMGEGHYFVHSQTAYNLLMRASDLGIKLDEGLRSKIINDSRDSFNSFNFSIKGPICELGSQFGPNIAIYHGIEITDPAPRQIGHQPVDLWAAMVKMIVANPDNELNITGRDKLSEGVQDQHRISQVCHLADSHFAKALISPIRSARKIKHIGGYPFFQKRRPYAEKDCDYTMLNLTDIPMGRDHVLPAGCILQRPFGVRHPVVLRMSAFCFNELDALSIFGNKLNIDTHYGYRGGDLHHAFEAWGELKEEAASGRL
jgi:hypothetical protein